MQLTAVSYRLNASTVCSTCSIQKLMKMLLALPYDRFVHQFQLCDRAEIKPSQSKFNKTKQFGFSDVIQQPALNVADRNKQRHTRMLCNRCAILNIRAYWRVRIHYSVTL